MLKEGLELPKEVGKRVEIIVDQAIEEVEEEESKD